MSTRRSRAISAVEASWGRASDFSQSYGRNSEYEQEILEDDTQDAFKLPYFKACLFATILEDIISQLYILVECNSEMRLKKTIIEMSALLALKYGVEAKKNTDELDDIDPKNLGCLEYKLRKLQSDRNLVLKVLQDTYLNLANYRHYNALNENVSQISERWTHLSELFEMESNNKILRRDLNRQLRQQRNHVKSVTYDMNNEIEFLKSHIEDAELNSEIRSRYVQSWQNARTEQHIQTIADKETVPYQVIGHLKVKAYQEQRVHSEIELLINIKINELLVQVEEWMAKYDKDMESMDLKIQLKKNEYEHMYDKRVELEKTIEKHEELINNWLKFKEDREAERQYREKMNRSAITVQAWWRGLLVRQQLGPYKVVKRKGQAPKTEEKTKKKKK